MSNYSRRDFIKTSGSILGAAALSGLTLSCHKNEAVHGEWAGFKYAMCNESMAELSWAEQCRIVSDAGYEGIEIAAFTLVEEGVQEIGPTGRKEMVSVMKNAGLACVGLHWLLAPPPKGLHFTTPDAGIRRKTVTYLDTLIDFCGDLGGSYMIFGSPKQRDTKGISVEQAKKYFAEGLAAVADHARQRGIEILVEPLGKRTTDVVNTMAEASQLAGQVNHPAIRMMFDFNNTVDETEPFDVLLRKHYKNIHHVHVQEMGGKHLGTGNAVNDYVKAFQVLKDMRYNHWISLEVFDFSPGGRTIAAESMRTLKQIEGKLT
ncbi:MAG TPA: sugar phosphate isomerase/epimerase family protein [Sedimentisphaerales bacterium]|nr:sugar phosphate isomerase/epimerase family protein [Sedimentisphaerales bacterium]